MTTELEIYYRLAALSDLNDLITVEHASFKSDHLSRRSLRSWVQSIDAIFLVAIAEHVEAGPQIVGYGLVWCHKGTRLARLYSLAVLTSMRGRGIAQALIVRLEKMAAERGRLFMRLEVAEHNDNAIRLYKKLGYHVFGEYDDYYDDHSDALRMHKKIKQFDYTLAQRLVPWYQQTTTFTCGPAALMMAMSSLDSTLILNQQLELDLWREATTIYMTSGHGGCHPVGLALAARRRGFAAQVFINTDQALFIDGVRSEHKKHIMTTVHQQFIEQAQLQDVTVHYQDIKQEQLIACLENNYAVIVLISSYQLDGKKAPHWVIVAGIDEHCFYVHDPDPDSLKQLGIDCQYLPIARSDFDAMSCFGSGRLRTAVAIRHIQGEDLSAG